MTNLLNFIPNSVNKIKRDISFESKISGGDYFDIKVIERVLSNIFNTYTDEHRDLDTDHAKHHFGVKGMKFSMLMCTAISVSYLIY